MRDGPDCAQGVLSWTRSTYPGEGPPSSLNWAQSLGPHS